jgi:hypothetical protein
MSAVPAGEEHVYLIGYPPFTDYLSFMTRQPLDARDADPRRIAEEWRAANDLVRERERSEAAWADGLAIGPVPPALQPLVARAVADPIYRRAFALVPAEVGVVELDRLIVTQKNINLAQVRRLTDRLGPAPGPEAIFRACLPVDQPVADCRVSHISNNTCSFISASNDLRFLESVMIRPEQLSGYQAVGPVAGVVGLAVGFGCNYLNAVSMEGRLVLCNGMHRAYALRELGVTHVPCVVQQVTRAEELNVVGTGALRRAPELYVRVPRPSLLKDFFDPRLSKVIRLAPKARVVRVTFTIEEFSVPG